jgi:hypothetical protein
VLNLFEAGVITEKSLGKFASDMRTAMSSSTYRSVAQSLLLSAERMTNMTPRVEEAGTQ